MLRRSPEGTDDFNLTCSEAECGGIKNDIAKKALKGWRNIYCYMLHYKYCLYLYRSFRTPLPVSFL
ncbi:hypothetical protein Barb4_05001 [Bacteroidales bacterium Barb4]|nr:hypothetical protein Barb4_05001 [Bacteroidales bacterium Barb4]